MNLARLASCPLRNSSRKASISSSSCEIMFLLSCKLSSHNLSASSSSALLNVESVCCRSSRSEVSNSPCFVCAATRKSRSSSSSSPRAAACSAPSLVVLSSSAFSSCSASARQPTSSPWSRSASSRARTASRNSPHLPSSSASPPPPTPRILSLPDGNRSFCLMTCSASTTAANHCESLSCKAFLASESSVRTASAAMASLGPSLSFMSRSVAEMASSHCTSLSCSASLASETSCCNWAFAADNSATSLLRSPSVG
mmetsp:Transcript_7293/g.26475  ORF Transcript_7293/g.26475 Transcript_7293/m.26475 type:complete len:256 (+) Transcript_7293:893-1660(+)